MGKFIQNGDAIDYTPGSAVAAGDVIVLEDMVAVAKRDIAADTLGALHISGVFEFPKRTADVVPMGDSLYWKAASGVAVMSAAGGNLIGKATAAAGNGDTIVTAKLLQ